MTHHTLTASVPTHLYGFVDKHILTGFESPAGAAFEPCVIIGVTSRPSRALHFEILCESGAKWANIPLHMLRWQKPQDGATLHPLTELQAWDCHGWDFSVFKFEYLFEMGCTFLTPTKKPVDAHYWFTLDHTDNGFSLYPPEHKNYSILLLEDGSGQIAAMPNNRIRWKDHSFCRPGPLPRYRVMPDTTWHAEEGDINPQDSAFTQEAAE